MPARRSRRLACSNTGATITLAATGIYGETEFQCCTGADGIGRVARERRSLFWCQRGDSNPHDGFTRLRILSPLCDQ